MKNFLLPFFVLFAFAASAQIEETLKNAAKSKVESQDFNSQRSNKERNMMDNKKRSSPAQPSPAAPPAPGSAAPESVDSTGKAPTEMTQPVMTQTPASGDAYTFGQKVTYTMDDPSKPDKEKTSVTYYYGENALMSTMPEQQMATIYNYTDETMISINEKGKTATIMSARWINREIEKTAESDVTVTKTGQTKVILGYNCEEYVIQDAKSKTVCWLTKEITVDYTKSLQVMSKSFSKSYAENFDGQGIAMEITTYDKKGEPGSHMIMTEFKEETTVKDLGGYTVTSLVMH